MNLRRILFAAPAVLLLGGPLSAQQPAPQSPPQSEEKPSLAELARKLREQRRAAPDEARKVWTNDNLPEGPGAVSVVGAAPPSAEAPAAPAELTEEQQELAAERERLTAELEAARAALDRERSRADILQRDYNLRREQFYSNPDFASDRAGLAALERMAAEIEQQGRVVDALEQQIDELERRLGELEHELGPRPEEPLTPEQQREQWRARIAPLREELARVEAELERMRGTTTARETGLIGVPTYDRTDELTRRRDELRREIAAIEDEAAAPASRPPGSARSEKRNSKIEI